MSGPSEHPMTHQRGSHVRPESPTHGFSNNGKMGPGVPDMVRILAERRARRLEPVQLPKGSVPREGMEPT
jgi:hypothetical protein